MAAPESVGMSAARLGRISDAMRRHIEARDATGIVTLVARHGRVVHFEAQGAMDIEGSAPMGLDTVFRLASMTKPVTSVAAMILHEEGHFFLDDPISRFLPAFKTMMVNAGSPPAGSHIPGVGLVPAHRPITMRDCLTHTAGFVSNEAINRTSVTQTIAERTLELAKRPLAFQPGTDWRYGPGHEVAGVVVEAISGMTLEAFCQERIFAPLGMPDSSFYLPEEKVGRFPTLYQAARLDEATGWKLKEVDRPATSVKVRGPKVQFAGGGGLLSTPADYARFGQMLLNGGELDGVRLLGRKSVELMTTNHIGGFFNYVRGRGYGYGLGFGVRTDLVGYPAVGTVGTYGWGGATGPYYSADPKEGLLCLLFQQVNAPEVPGPDDAFSDDPKAPGIPRRIGQELEQFAYEAIVD